MQIAGTNSPSLPSIGNTTNMGSAPRIVAGDQSFWRQPPDKPINNNQNNSNQMLMQMLQLFMQMILLLMQMLFGDKKGDETIQKGNGTQHRGDKTTQQQCCKCCKGGKDENEDQSQLINMFKQFMRLLFGMLGRKGQKDHPVVYNKSDSGNKLFSDKHDKRPHAHPGDKENVSTEEWRNSPERLALLNGRMKIHEQKLQEAERSGDSAKAARIRERMNQTRRNRDQIAAHVA